MTWECYRNDTGQWCEFPKNVTTFHEMETFLLDIFKPLHRLETNLWQTAEKTYQSQLIREQGKVSEPLHQNMVDPPFSLDELELAQQMIAGEK